MLRNLQESLSHPKDVIKKQVAYSCVVDRDPDSFFQSLIFISSLIELAHVPSSNIFIHHIGEPDHVVAKIYHMIGVNVIQSVPYNEDNRSLNKLVQLKTPDLAEFDKIVLCDCAIAITEAVEPDNFPKDIYAKEVDLPNPPTWVLRRLLYCAGIEATPEVLTTTFRALSGKFIFNHDIAPENEFEFSTLTNNCNSGIYVIDHDTLLKLSVAWPSWADWLLTHSALLGSWVNHADQISLALATWSTGMSVKPLLLAWNFPLHLPLTINEAHPSKPKVLNYHNEFTAEGLIKQIEVPSVDKIISRVNESHENFLSKLTVEAPELGEELRLRRQRWLEWNNDIRKRPLPLPDHMGCEKPLIAIETGGQCNYRCSYCPVSVTPVRKGILNAQIFNALLDELIPHDGTFQLRFHFYNEPLLDTRLPELINYAKKRLPSTYIRLVSNGELLDVDSASTLFSSGVDQIAVSCHKKEVFQRLTEVCNNHPDWNLALREAYSVSTWSDRRGLIDLQSHGFTRCVPAGVKPWGCSYLTIQVDYLGKVHMCCEDFRGELILGDVLEEGLNSILARNQGRLKRAYCGFFDSTCIHCAGFDLFD